MRFRGLRPKAILSLMLLSLPHERHHRLVPDRMRRQLPSIRGRRLVHDDCTGPSVETEPERGEGARKRRLVVVRRQQFAKARMRRERHGRSDRAGRVRDVDVPPLSEVHEMEAECHDTQQHAKRGEGMGSGGSEYPPG